MTFSADNYCSVERTFSRYITEETMKQQREIAENLFERESVNSDDEGKEPRTQNYINAKTYLSSNFKNKRQRTNAIASLNSEHASLSSRSIKVAPNMKGSSSARRAFLYWLCMQ